MESTTPCQAWLAVVSGGQRGQRHLLRKGATRVGRDPSNDVVIAGSGVVSGRHLEIGWNGESFRVRDLGSTNGTYVGGRRITEAELPPETTLRLGVGGPDIQLLTRPGGVDPEETVVVAPGESPPVASTPPPIRSVGHHESLLSAAVDKVRSARQAGLEGQTAVIMREMLGAVHRAHHKWKIALGCSLILLLAVSGYAYWRIQQLQQEKSDIDQEIEQIEARLAEGGLSAPEAEELIARLNRYQARAEALQESLFYRWGVGVGEEAYIRREIRTLMQEFGAQAYQIPPEFVEQVRRFIERFQNNDRQKMERALGRARDKLERIQAILAEENLPPALAYIVLVESAFSPENTSSAGAAGLWQFTASTARAHGLKVNETVDERRDLEKSTKAAARYLRRLIAEFGAGSSVMLALAAYNLGPTRIRRTIRKVEDPIKQRNFWHLYRTRALPVETREYVPKIVAAIIIGRNPEHFGF